MFKLANLILRKFNKKIVNRDEYMAIQSATYQLPPSQQRNLAKDVHNNLVYLQAARRAN